MTFQVCGMSKDNETNVCSIMLGYEDINKTGVQLV